MFKLLDWEHRGINVSGELLNHLRFADDIALIGNNGTEIEEMMNELNEESKKLGLKINFKKTKVMYNAHASKSKVYIGNQEIEMVDEYIYLGQLVSMQTDKSNEVKRRIAAGWIAFNNHRDLLKGKLPMCLKRKIYNQCVLPAMTYGCQTWALTKRMEQRLRVTQRSMERAMLGITRMDRQRNECIRGQTQVQDVIQKVKRLKWQWAGHIARMTDNRWTKLVTEWLPLNEKRKRGRPKTRWVDEIEMMYGVTWMRTARDRTLWKNHEEAFIQQWIDNGS